MQKDARVYSLPKWRLTRWLVDAGPGIPDDIRDALIASLFSGLPVFFGGAVNVILVAGAVALQTQKPVFIAWFVFEVVVCLARLVVLVIARRAALARRKTPTDLYLLLGLAWSCGVGYGVLTTMASGNWLIASATCLSGAAMVGGICLRNFGAPRLAAAMIFCSIGPSIAGAALAGEPLYYIVFIQAPMYFFAMAAAAFRLKTMLVTSMLAERENDHRARHDALTGLPNRHGLVNAAEAKLAAACETGRPLSLLFVDLDGFKAVNDTYGHAAGDTLLKLVAERLRHMLRPDDLAARIGGDEFVMLVANRDERESMAFAEQLIATVSSSYDLGGGANAPIGLSIGIAMAPEHGASIEALLASADAALYEAKSKGKCRCCMASVAANIAALQRLSGHTVTGEASSVAA
ncbi:GGDEF domain-containing protein [Undibacter mobilis]|uniref:GGDEF domain-containing protein n=1 Tax=Undibacter mobilis TaxID=2292256 RepID=A0A371B7B0_9BRAD|nr:GGDEF domain-containing protein [Undibacter mobilis]RDV03387.1 GGDEF domain-containing protein [Undibacter mobilis]